MAIIVAEQDTEVKEIYKKSPETGELYLTKLLTLRPGFEVKCPRCGHTMIRYGITNYKKHIEDMRNGGCTRIFHLQILTCPNKNKCSDITSGKDPQGKNNKATHVLLPDYACPDLRVQSDEAEDLAKAYKEINRLKEKLGHKRVSQNRIEHYITLSPLLKKLKRKYVNFQYFLGKALGPLGKNLSEPVIKLLSIARSVFDSYNRNYNSAPVKTRGQQFDIKGKSIFRIFGVYCCSQFVKCSPIHLKHNWPFSYSNIKIKERNDSS